MKNIFLMFILGIFFEGKDMDVLKTEEYFRMCIDSDPDNAETLCVYAQFLEKKRDYVQAEGNL